MKGLEGGGGGGGGGSRYSQGFPLSRTAHSYRKWQSWEERYVLPKGLAVLQEAEMIRVNSGSDQSFMNVRKHQGLKATGYKTLVKNEMLVTSEYGFCLLICFLYVF